MSDFNATWCKTTLRVFSTKNGGNLGSFELIKTAKKQHKATVPGKHFVICMNSDSNFPKQVPVDFKKFRSV